MSTFSGRITLRNLTYEVHFIDAREFGTMISRKQKELLDEDIGNVSDTYHKWRSKEFETGYKNIAGFCKSANIKDISKNN